MIPEANHNTEQYVNNRAELSHQPTRVRERGMRRFKSIEQAQRFLKRHAAVYNLFNLQRGSDKLTPKPFRKWVYWGSCIFEMLLKWEYQFIEGHKTRSLCIAGP